MPVVLAVLLLKYEYVGTLLKSNLLVGFHLLQSMLRLLTTKKFEKKFISGMRLEIMDLVLVEAIAIQMATG